MVNELELPARGGPRVAAAAGDAVGWGLLIDAVAAGLLGIGSIAFVFFRVPAWVPGRAVVPALLGAGILLRWRAAVAAAVGLAILNALQYAGLVAAGAIAGSAVSFSGLLALALAPALWARRRAPLWAVFPAAGALLLAHLLTFGATDYRRHADAIVVFGARAYPNGQPSQALYDRTLTGVRLYHQGRAPRLILSGGLNEPEVMKRLALAWGVPAGDIVLDAAGVNTAATLRNLAGRQGTILAVSHYYHAARIRMTAGRMGIDCRTVPATMTRRLVAEPYFVLRECAAFAAYYLAVG